MSVLARVAKCLETIAPLSLAEAWDNTGLLIEAPFPRPGASKIMLTIDLTNSVVDECLNDKQVSVVVAYHPPIFKKFNRLCLSDEKQAIALRIAAAGISVVSHHTAHDNVVGGVNDWLCKAFPPGVTKPMHPLASPPDGHEGAGGGRVHILAQPITLDDTIAHIKKHLGLKFGFVY